MACSAGSSRDGIPGSRSRPRSSTGGRGFHGSIHLALNAFLILECGRPCERLLGHGRFLLLCLLSLAANAGAQLLAGGVNGSSLVIWAWGPPLFVAMTRARRLEPVIVDDPRYARLRTILLLIYLAIPLGMTLVPYAAGWRGNPLVGFLRANIFHIVATAVGAAFAAAGAGWIRRRMTALAAVSGDGGPATVGPTSRHPRSTRSANRGLETTERTPS